MKNNFRILGHYEIGNMQRFAIFTSVLALVMMMAMSIIFAKVLINFSGQYVTTEKHNQDIQKLEQKFDKTVAQYKKKMAMIQANEKKTIRDCKATVVKYKKAKDDAERKFANLEKTSGVIMKKYWYIYRDYKKTDLKLTDLINLDKTAKINNINPHLVVATMGLESKLVGKSKNKRSSASGYGQFINSTGRFVYKKLLASRGGYNHRNMTSDSKIGVNMTIAYLKYQLKGTGGSVRRTLMIYSGRCLGNKYYDIVRNNMTRAGVKCSINHTTYI